MRDQKHHCSPSKSYTNPLEERYASEEMLYLFSNHNRHKIWRQLWVALAQAEQQAGITSISQEQIEEMEAGVENIDYQVIDSFEQETKHEVFAHIKAFGAVCPSAAGIIHLGETSAYVIDNSDLILFKEGLKLLERKLLKLIHIVADFAKEHATKATLAFTHFQVAQPTTVGKRATLWLNSLIADLNTLQREMSALTLRGIQGTTGSAASFKNLLKGDYQKLFAMNDFLAKSFGFSGTSKVTSQTYDRKIDVSIAHVLNQIAVSAHKITNDLRLLQHSKEISEHFSSTQVGSSAMPYKRNPIVSERVSSLAKFVSSIVTSTTAVASTQWLERTLDDSANKRLTLPQAFLATDAIIDLLTKLFSNIVVHQEVINANLERELPFLLTENILMEYSKEGGDRQVGHEKIKNHAMRAFQEVQKGQPNKLLTYILEDESLKISPELLKKLLNHKELIGFCKEQVLDYLSTELPK